MVGLTWNARVLDRRLLTGLEWPVWDSVATDAPEPAHGSGHRRRGRSPAARVQGQQNAAWLAGALERRRDELPVAARRFYDLLAAEADVYASDKAERVEAIHAAPGVLDLAIYPAEGEAATAPLFHRRFDADNTKESDSICTGATTLCW